MCGIEIISHDKGVLLPNGEDAFFPSIPDERGRIPVMSDEHEFTLALFYCRNTPGSSEQERQALEKEYGRSLRLFSLPCGGRMEPLHLLKSLEQFADAAYLVACPEGACRYFEGSRRAAKRVDRTKEILRAIGLEPERAGIVIHTREEPRTLADLARETMTQVAELGISPVLKAAGKKKGRHRRGKKQ